MENRLKWFSEARFGMFIHWGIYALLGRGEWVMYLERIPKDEYAQLAHKFRAEQFDPVEWAAMARDAGMRYMVLTSRHHDGFSLFDTKFSEFKSTKTPANIDIIAEYVEACRSAGLKVGLYYSLLDWRWDAYWKGPVNDPKGWGSFLEYVHGQLEELCSSYGRIDVLWFDGNWPYTAQDWRAQELLDKIRRLQPQIIVNNRTGLPGDFETPEQHVPWWSPPRRAWETCMTMNDSWGYFEGDRNWKSPRQIINTLVTIVSMGGNLLLNVGPRGDGSFPPEAVEILSHIGEWMRVNGESIYGASGAPFTSSVGPVTAKGRTAYIHALRWPGSRITVARVGNSVLSAHLLADGRKVKFRQEGDRVFLEGLPPAPPDPYDAVIKFELDSEPKAFS
ncbi:MAG: alpha-L-fucosidase [Thermofilaceae archaeon]|nr:alpha-L-fucosidase [Thermofilaceae archaeon]MDW8003858.1 alpha-L-fucosidase [Thermofilaceae archaeon]